MIEIKNILLKVFTLTIDILFLGFQTIKQIVLPNLNRRGNLLSSIFLFFIGIVERLNSFEHGVFDMATLFRRRYIRKAILITGAVLFLLALLEWSGDQRVTQQTPSEYSEQFSSGTSSNITDAKSHYASYFFPKNRIRKPFSICKCLDYYFPVSAPFAKKYILVRSIRV
jgi:hypothetical protein